MKKSQRSFAVLLVFVIIAGLFLSIPSTIIRAETKGEFIVNMKCEDIINPIGVDAENPRFSWQMDSEEFGQKQTAYQLEVAADIAFSDILWNSGKVEKSESIGIKYAGDALEASTKYYWRVSLWDKDSVKQTSQTATFETGLFGNKGWQDTEWIQMGNSYEIPEEDADFLNYTLEADFQIEKGAVSVVFQADDKSTFLMWQFLEENGSMFFRPHYKVNGNYGLIVQNDVTSNLQGNSNSSQHLKIEIVENEIRTYLNGNLVSTINNQSLNGITLSGSIGNLGFRVTDNGQESGWLDNIVLTDYLNSAQGIVLINYAFEDGKNPFNECCVRAGRLYISNNGAQEVIGLYKNGESVSSDTHYYVEADITCIQNGASIVFGATNTKNFYLFQLNTFDDSAKVFFKPHSWKNNGFAIYSNHVRDVTSLVGGVDQLKTIPVHVKIEVTAAEIKTYIKDTLIDTFPFQESQGIDFAMGYIGIRSSDSEEFEIDNLKLTDCSENTENVVYNYTFDDPTDNPFFYGTIENGKLKSQGDGVLLPPIGSPTFRKEFDLNENAPVKSARLYTSGLGVYDTYINGERAGHETDSGIQYDELKPGNSRPNDRVYYYSYDVTGMLKNSNRHTISAVVTSGWYTGQIAKPPGSEEAYLAKLVITYENGEVQVISTDRTWKNKLAGPVLMADIYNGEVFDGGADLSFRMTGYDDSDWCYADLNKEFQGEITSQLGATVRVREDLTLPVNSVIVYEGVTGADSTKYGKINILDTYDDGEAFILQPGQKAIVDYGQNFAGWDEIQVEGTKGTKVTMRHAEILNDKDGLKSRMNDGPEGSLYTTSLRTARATGIYYLKGEGIETYKSSFTYYGFRYAEITTDHPITIHGQRGLVVTSVLNDTGYIETSDEDVNQLYSNIRWGQYGNYLSIPTDCPQRNEREGWTGDTQVFSITASYNAESKAFLTKWMTDMRDAQRNEPGAPLDGAYPDMAPGYGYMGELGWADAGIIVPYHVYKMYGDTHIIEENYASMQKYIDVYLAKSNKQGAGRHYGDWLSYESNDDEIKSMLAVLYYALDASYMSKMAAVLGKEADAKRYMELFETEKAYFIENFVKSDGTLKRSEQSVNAMALHVGILKDDQSYQAVKQTLLDNIESNGNKLQTGFLGTSILMQTLSKIGATDVAYKLLLQRENPSWLYSVDQGATTIWERWNSYTTADGFIDNEMNSFNHYAYGVVGEWMYSYMAGILCDEEQPGFQHFVLAPNPDTSIRYVNSLFDSPYGTIMSNWKKADGVFEYTVKVPANTTAEIRIPTEEGKIVMVNEKLAGKTVLAADAIELTETIDGIAVFHATAGTFHFYVGDERERYANELRRLINSANGKLDSATFGERNGDYPDKQRNLVITAVSDAQTLIEQSDCTVEQLVQCIEDLNKALKAFDASVVVVDYDILNHLVETYQQLIDNVNVGNGNNQYPTTQEIQAAINKAKEAADNDRATQMDINAEVENLQYAMNTFEDSRIIVRFDALENAIQKAEKQEQIKYTAGSWNELQRSLENGYMVRQMQDITQDQVDVAEQAITIAISKLVSIEGISSSSAFGENSELIPSLKTKSQSSAPKTGDDGIGRTAFILLILSSAAITITANKNLKLKRRCSFGRKSR